MNLLGIFLLHLGPLLLLSIPIILLVRGIKKSSIQPPQKLEPNINELEEKLKNLIEKNHITNTISNLKEDLKNSSSNTIAK